MRNSAWISTSSDFSDSAKVKLYRKQACYLSFYSVGKSNKLLPSKLSTVWHHRWLASCLLHACKTFLCFGSLSCWKWNNRLEKPTKSCRFWARIYHFVLYFLSVHQSRLKRSSSLAWCCQHHASSWICYCLDNLLFCFCTNCKNFFSKSSTSVSNTRSLVHSGVMTLALFHGVSAPGCASGWDSESLCKMLKAKS